jgi:hypothetical protein
MSCIYLEILSKIYISIAVYRKVRKKQSKKKLKKNPITMVNICDEQRLSSFIYLEN